MLITRKSGSSLDELLMDLFPVHVPYEGQVREAITVEIRGSLIPLDIEQSAWHLL
jgi:hypothetical protein